jgi:hypothetical protein
MNNNIEEDDTETLICVIGDVRIDIPNLFCVDCNRMTLSTEPVIMQRINNKFQFHVVCVECGNTKSRLIKCANQLKQLPPALNNFDNYRLYVNEYKHNNKIIIFSDIINKLLKWQAPQSQNQTQLSHIN